MEHTSQVRCNSSAHDGVHYTVLRMSFARRLELLGRIRSVGGALQFLQAGSQLGDRLEASRVQLEIDRLYLEWGLVSVEGLLIDGQPATPTALWDLGPPGLVEEVLSRIRAETHLSTDERKN